MKGQIQRHTEVMQSLDDFKTRRKKENMAKIKEGTETYASKSAMMKHEKAESKLVEKREQVMGNKLGAKGIKTKMKVMKGSNKRNGI